MNRRTFFKSLIGQSPIHRENQGEVFVAHINYKDCLAWGGGDCTMCYIQCPLPDKAIFLDSLKPVVQAAKCDGCGICEKACQLVNDRVAIRVIRKM